jgi:hypothetical protein
MSGNSESILIIFLQHTTLIFCHMINACVIYFDILSYDKCLCNFSKKNLKRRDPLENSDWCKDVGYDSCASEEGPVVAFFNAVMNLHVL